MTSGMSWTEIRDVGPHIEKFFGVSWDRVLAGLVYGLASGWLWWAMLTSTRPRSPLDGLSRLLETLSITPPEWISDGASWLSHPARGGLVVVLAVGAGLVATIYARTQSTGSEIACVILTLAAFQGGGWTALMIVVVTVVAPVALSLLLVATQHSSKKSAGERPFEELLGHHTASTSVAGALSSSIPFWLVLLAPLAVVAIAVRCLRADRAIDEAGELSQSALHRLRTGSAADQRAAAQSLIVAGALLSDPHDHRARQESALMLRLMLNGPTGAAPVPPQRLL
ncbi:hypothetical protein ACFS27_23200 [Promicromonospora vindobonensis]|uniref:Uncharacterized protein n=1 Tax=Promicromonospora vindobonensis TaxID=195748 RepID=A0ABW5VXU2_9MICO